MIGIFGGTFDPVHLGHLRPALELFETLELAQLRLLPCGVPAHRGSPGESTAQRLAMLHLASAGQSGFVVDERELRRPGPSYMVDTLRSLRDELGVRQPLALLLGLDAFLGLGSWHRWQELVGLAHIVVAHRPGWTLGDELSGAEAARSLLQRHRVEHWRELHSRPAGGVWLQAVTQLDISATAIRGLRAEGRSIRYLVPDAVWHHIETEGLYLNNAS